MILLYFYLQYCGSFHHQSLLPLICKNRNSFLTHGIPPVFPAEQLIEREFFIDPIRDVHEAGRCIGYLWSLAVLRRLLRGLSLCGCRLLVGRGCLLVGRCSLCRIPLWGVVRARLCLRRLCGCLCRVCLCLTRCLCRCRILLVPILCGCCAILPCTVLSLLVSALCPILCRAIIGRISGSPSFFVLFPALTELVAVHGDLCHEHTLTCPADEGSRAKASADDHLGTLAEEPLDKLCCFPEGYAAEVICILVLLAILALGGIWCLHAVWCCIPGRPSSPVTVNGQCIGCL